MDLMLILFGVLILLGGIWIGIALSHTPGRAWYVVSSHGTPIAVTTSRQRAENFVAGYSSTNIYTSVYEL